MNAAIIESPGRPLEPRPVRPRLLYPALVVAAISVTLFSLVGIAAMTGLIPSAHSSPQETATARPLPAGKSIPAAKSVAPASASASTDKTRIAATSCSDCGTVESISTVERQADTTGVGAVAGGLTGALLGNQIGRGSGRTVMTIAGGAGGAYLGNKIEGNTRRSTAYKIVVRMDNGSERTIHQTEAPGVAVGGQVRVVGSSVVART
jgi:outer membrane lipoprotein SlyB